MKTTARKLAALCGAVLSMAAAPSHAVTVVNAGFETGTTASWNVATDTAGAATVTTTGANSGTYGLVLWANNAYNTDVTQTLTGVPNGQYLLTAMFENGGGQASAYLYAKNCGGAVRQTSIPVSAGWTKVVVRGIQVSGGNCTIGVHASAAGKQWLAMDNVEFTLDTGPAYSFLQGGDLSRLSYLEQLGAKFYEGGVQKDAMQILANNGFNFVRLRAYNDPGNPCCSPSNTMPPGIETTADILSLARRAGANGMQVDRIKPEWFDGVSNKLLQMVKDLKWVDNAANINGSSTYWTGPGAFPSVDSLWPALTPIPQFNFNPVP